MGKGVNTWILFLHALYFLIGSELHSENHRVTQTLQISWPLDRPNFVQREKDAWMLIDRSCDDP